MICGRLRHGVLLGLGVLAGAVLPVTLAAQVPTRPDTARAPRDTVPTRVDTARARQVRAPQGRDTIRVPTPPKADSMVKNDSLLKGIVPLPPGAPDTVKKDTIMAPLARAEAPLILEIGAPRIYDRAALYASGALTLADLVGRAPGVTEFTTGWLGAPTVVASQGDMRAVRVFLDGLEIDPLGRRAQGVSPINDLPILALEEVRIERAAEEVRVYARSWRVDRTSPYTRADIYTGDQNTNLYRAFFGRRYDHGEVLQLAAEQFSTQPDRRLPSSGALHLVGRVGLTHGPWSADLFAERSDIDQGPWVGTGNIEDTRDTVAALETRRTLGYARFGNGDPERGSRWFQLLIATEAHQGTPRVAVATADTNPVVHDTTQSEAQYVVTGGVSFMGVRLSALERLRHASGRTSHVLSGRASFDQPWLGVSLFAEGKSALYPARVEGTVKLNPLDRLTLLATASRTGAGLFSRVFGDFTPGPDFNADGSLTRGNPVEIGGLYDSTHVSRYALDGQTNLRAEVGIRVVDVWVMGGILRRGGTTLLPPAGFDTSYAHPGALRVDEQASGATAAVRGHLYKALYIDAWGVHWTDSTGLYRPQWQTRTELYLQTNLLKRFPRGNFGLLGSLTHEYRSNVRFAAPASFPDSVRIAAGFRALAFKLEIRIATAVVSYQFRNLLQEKYAPVPGFFLPRQTQFYGVRWDFWN